MPMKDVKKDPVNPPVGGRGKPSSSPVDPYMPELGNHGYRVTRYDLDLTYRVSPNKLSGTASISIVATETLSRFKLDFGPALRVSKIDIDGRAVAGFRSGSGKIAVRLKDILSIGQAATITVRYSGNPRPRQGPCGAAGWEELTEGALVASQPHGASSWFPCNDHPGGKASFRIAITTDSPFRVIASGNLVDKKTSGSLTRWTYDLPEPTSTYLVALAIGKFDRVDILGSAIPIRGFLPSRLKRNFAFDFGRQDEMMNAFIHMFGPYPYPAYTVVVTDDDLEIPLEAMAMSTFGANHCRGGRAQERLVAHELSHQWFGNSVTAQLWKDIWLHEGFACYAEWLWSESSGGPDSGSLALKNFADLQRQPQDLIISDPGPALMFDDRVYKRGALTVHALRLTLGERTFFDMLRNWTLLHAHSAVTVEQFYAHAAGYTTVDLAPLWDVWLHRADLPPVLGHPLL